MDTDGYGWIRILQKETKGTKGEDGTKRQAEKSLTQRTRRGGEERRERRTATERLAGKVEGMGWPQKGTKSTKTGRRNFIAGCEHVGLLQRRAENDCLKTA